jgi:hypothetical protein
MRDVALPVLLLIAFTAACAKQASDRKETYPVTGEVYVDGRPAPMIQVNLHNLAGIDQQQPTHSSAFTDDAGKFEVSTYEQGDGVPEGEYVLSFVWGQFNMVSMQYGGPDKLKDKYADPKTSTFKVRVEKGKPANLGRIELETK